MFDYKFSLHNTFEAMVWFKEQINDLKNQPKTIEEKKERKNREKDIISPPDRPIDTFEVGKMYLFHYDPKNKNSLEYYDTFPLILLIGIHKGGFTGLNLHYLPVEMRTKMLSNMSEKAVLKDGELDRLRVTYDGIKNVSTYQMYKPCLKQYCTSQIRSSVKLINPVDWGFAAILPIENFKKQTKQKVWKESMNSLDMTL